MAAWLGRACAVAVALLAWRIARLRPHHRLMALWLAVAAVADVARWALSVPLLAGPSPYSGPWRAVFHVDQAMMLAEPFGLVMVGMCATAACNPIHVGGAYALTWTALLVTYPHVRGKVLGHAYLAVEVGAMVALGACAFMWSRKRCWPTMTEILIAAYGATRAAMIAGPFVATGGLFENWWRGDVAQLSCVLCSLLVHAAWWHVIKPRR